MRQEALSSCKACRLSQCHVHGSSPPVLHSNPLQERAKSVWRDLLPIQVSSAYYCCRAVVHVSQGLGKGLSLSTKDKAACANVQAPGFPRSSCLTCHAIGEIQKLHTLWMSTLQLKLLWESLLLLGLKVVLSLLLLFMGSDSVQCLHLSYSFGTPLQHQDMKMCVKVWFIFIISWWSR